LDGIVCSQCDPQVCLFEHVCNKCGLFANVCKGDPFLCGAVCCLSDVVLGCLWLGKTLFSIMVWMVLILSWYSCMCRWYVLSQLYRNLIAVYLFWAGWLEE